MTKDRTVILGAGMAGFGACHRLNAAGLRGTVYEMESRIGGHTRSFVHGGKWIFDDGPHVSFTKDKRIQDLFAEFVDHQYETIQVSSNNYWRGHWIKHPAICNLHGLPTDMVVDCIADFVDAHRAPPAAIDNYEQWLLASYGKTFFENFPRDYTVRYHTVEARHMDTDWLGPRLYEAELKEVLLGALSPVTPDIHYVTHFRYPQQGGFESYLRPFPSLAEVHCDHRVTAIDPGSRVLTFAQGGEAPFDHLVSSLPLPRLIEMLPDVPARVREAAEALAVSECIVVNVGLGRDDISASQWTYFYDRDFFFTRLSFPHMLSPSTVPPGCGAIQAECYYSAKYRPCDVTPEACIEPVLRDLRRCGMIRDTDEILITTAHKANYGNVIFDLDRKAALKEINDYLDELGIHRCGRYAEWGYHWTDESFKSGENRAQVILDRLG
jgi:protoporphyrinogen oxidase